MKLCINYLIVNVQVVEIVDRYDKDCVPSTYNGSMLEFIQSSETNKTCIKTLTVSAIPLYRWLQINYAWSSFLWFTTFPWTPLMLFFRCQRRWNSQFLYIISLTTFTRIIAGTLCSFFDFMESSNVVWFLFIKSFCFLIDTGPSFLVRLGL